MKKKEDSSQEEKLAGALGNIGGVSDDKEFDSFIAKTDKISEQKFYDGDEEKAEPADAPADISGWVNIDRSELSERGVFYPDNWDFFIRPATVEAIKAWSVVDDTNPNVVDNALNDVLKQCVKIMAGPVRISWNKLAGWDRFWFVLKVRELTFVKGESKIEFTEPCDSCGEEITYTLDAGSLIYDAPADEDIKESYDQETREWHVAGEDYGDTTGELGDMTFYIPTIEKDIMTKEWLIKKVQAKESFDEVFLKYLPWLLAKTPRDSDMFAHQVAKIFKDYKSWSTDKFTFINSVIDSITVTPSQSLKAVCPSCGEAAVSSIKFPAGIRSLFTVKSRYKKFGAK